MARAMNGTELGYIRRDGQSSQLFMAVYKPAVVYTARVNQTFSSLDKVIQVTYDTGSGTLGNVLPGMTMYVGTAAGLSDVGMVRIRKAPSGTVFYVGENAELAWADNLYLTVVDDFGVWPRHVQIDPSTFAAYMDQDIAYSDQHALASPIPILGPRFVPAWLTGATVVLSFDSSLSYVLGSSIASVLWAFPGASATSGLTTHTPTATYNATGTYRGPCQLTAANGKVTTGYVRIRVFNRSADPPVTQFDLVDTIRGSWSEGGYQAKIKMWAEADFSSVVDRAMVVIFARDFYGVTEASIGAVASRENIVMTGWIDGESIIQNPDGSEVSFTVEGVHAWMKKISGFAVGIQNKTGVAAVWTDWQNLTVDKSLYHLFFWQSTIIPVVDVFLTLDTKLSTEQSAPTGTIYEQVTYLLKNTLLGTAGADRFNRLFCEVDLQLTPPANRGAVPVVLDLQQQDWREQMRMSRIVVRPTALVDLSGVVIDAGNLASPIFSLAPGHVPEHWGRTIKQDRMLLATQAQANELAAMKLAWDDHQFEFDIDLAGNNRMVDIFPSQQFVGMVVNQADTPRGFTFNGHVIVREINMSLAQDAAGENFLQISWHAENETFPEIGRAHV
jgi:hypothetical protein